MSERRGPCVGARTDAAPPSTSLSKLIPKQEALRAATNRDAARANSWLEILNRTLTQEWSGEEQGVSVRVDGEGIPPSVLAGIKAAAEDAGWKLQYEPPTYDQRDGTIPGELRIR